MSNVVDPSAIFDSFDVDLVVKVLSHTLFSMHAYLLVMSYALINRTGPFFIVFVPIFYYFQGAKITEPVIYLPVAYYLVISLFCTCSSTPRRRIIDRFMPIGFVKWYSLLYRNQGSLFFAPSRFDWGEQIVVITGGPSLV